MAVTPSLFGEPTEPEAPAPGVLETIGDVGKAAASGTVDLAAQGVGLLADSFHAPPNSGPRELQDRLNDVSDTIKDYIAPANRQAMEAEIIPQEGQPSALKTPVRSAAMKLGSMAPQLLGALFLPPGWAGVAAGSTFFGMQGVAQQLNDSRKMIMGMTDEELAERSPLYRGLREDNDEITARQKLMDAGNDAVSLLLTGGANAVAGGALAHALRGTVGSSVLRSMGIGTADALVGGFVQGAGAEAGRENADVNMALRESSSGGDIALAGLNSALTFAPLGAAFGAAQGVGNRRRARAEKARADGTVVEPNGPSPAQQAATEATFTNSDTGKTEEPAPPSATPAPPAAPPAGTLAQRVAAERAARAEAAAQPVAPPPPPGAPQAPPSPPVAPARPAEPSRPAAPPLPIPPPLKPQDIFREPLPNLPPQPPPRPRAETPVELPVAVAPSVTPEGTGPLSPAAMKAAAEQMPQKPARSVERPVAEAAEAAKAADPLAELNAAVKPAPAQKPTAIVEMGVNAAGERLFRAPDWSTITRVLPSGKEIVQHDNGFGERQRLGTDFTPVEPKKEEPALVDTTKPVPEKRTLTAKRKNPITEMFEEAQAEQNRAAVAKRKPRVIKVKAEIDPIAEAKRKVEEEEASEKLREAARLASKAERARIDRLTKKNLPNEAKAADIVKRFHPEEGTEAAADLQTIENAALGHGGVAGVRNARELLRGRANEIIAAAENAGVRIPRRTMSSKELSPEQRNPTPFTSRLIEMRRFDELVKAAERITSPSNRETKLQRLYQHFVDADRALRSGDVERAAERRLATNDEHTEAHRKRELEKLAKEQQEDLIDEHANSMQPEDIQAEESDVRVTSNGKADHYAVDEARGVRHSTVKDEMQQLINEFSGVKEPVRGERAQLLTQIMRRIAERAGNTPMHFVHDREMRRTLGMQEGGRRGFFHFAMQGKVGGHRGDIYIDNDVMHSVDGPHVVLHEAIHAAMNHAIDKVPGLADDLVRIADATRDSFTAAGKDAGAQYGLTAKVMLRSKGVRREVIDPREFMAEAISNPEMRKHMVETPAPKWMIDEWNLSRPMSLWRAFVGRITKALGLGEKHVTLMDAILHHFDRAVDYEPVETKFGISDLRASTPGLTRVTSAIHIPTREEVREQAPHYAGSIRNRVRGALNKVATFDQLAQGANHLFGEGDVATKLARIMGRMGHEKTRILEATGGKELVDRTAALVRKHTASRMADRYGDFLLDETGAGVFADRPLKGQRRVTSQGMARHAQLAADYAKLPEDLKKHRADAQRYFRQMQDDASLATLRNIVRVINDGVPDDALAKRIFDKNYTDDIEKEVVERDGVIKAINNARALRKVNGPYFPMMRHGDHVVSGTYKITTPAGAERLNAEGRPDPKGNVFQFKTKEAARKFAASTDLHVMKEQHIYVDSKTGERFGVDHDGTKVKLTKEDVAANTAEHRWRVQVQDRHLEFFETEVAARQRHAELSRRADMSIDGVSPKKWEPTGKNATFLSHEFDRALNSLRQRNGFKALPEEARREMENHLRDAFLSALGPTRAQSRRLPRTHVAGASNDIFKTTRQYASSMSGYLARQKHQPQVDAAMKELNDYTEAHRYESTDRTYPRGQVLKEFQQRVFAQGEPEPTDMLHKGISRLLQISMLDKLASPAYHVINSSEPWTISLPVLAGRHGVGKTMFELNRAYRDIGAGAIIKQGAVNTVRAAKNDIRESDYLKPIVDRVRRAADGKHLQDMMTELHDLGIVSRDAGMEVGRMSDPGAGLLLRGLDRADLMARQLGTAIESINRLVTAISAYRLEFDKTKDHQAAKDYAIQQTINTMGDYSGWNAPAAFNHPLGRLALQFKKYAQKTYYLLGKTAAASLKGDREAMKQFAGIMATHALLAGTLGLPLEAVKAAFIGAGLLGLTSSNYGDFEQFVRRQAAGLFGQAGGEIVTRGLPRYLGVDLSSRVGLENLLLPLGDPKSMKPQDLMAYGAQAFAGAPISMLAEYPRGMQALLDGNFVEAARVLVPLKVFADTMQAAQRMTVGKQTPSGRQSLEPYTVAEGVIKALGFTPGRDAETGEMRAAMQGDLTRFRADRSKLVSGWVTAAPNDKTTAWHKVQQWNAGQPAAARITMAELSRGVQQRKREAAGTDNADAIRTTKRDRHIRADNSFYNVH